VGDAVQVYAYEHGAGLSATPLRLRYVPIATGRGGGGAPVELDPPAAADAWSAALNGRTHAGIFTVSGIGVDAFGGAPHYLLSSPDGARALQRSSAHAPGGWAPQFGGGVLARAAARDAPCAARGFAVRVPFRRIRIANLISCLTDAHTLRAAGPPLPPPAGVGAA
jgi:hypothetical protein